VSAAAAPPLVTKRPAQRVSTRHVCLAAVVGCWSTTAIAFLQQLSDAERQRLAASPMPLAKFADVRTPDEAVAPLMPLPEMERLPALPMFEKAGGS
jgi:hypothetical protein